jgi:hypothetical protein
MTSYIKLINSNGDKVTGSINNLSNVSYLSNRNNKINVSNTIKNNSQI